MKHAVFQRLHLPALALAWALAAPASAHQFWLEPQTYQGQPGARIFLQIMIGEPFAGEPMARNESHIALFSATGAGGTDDVPGMVGRGPAGILRLQDLGATVVAYLSSGVVHEMLPDKFRSYLVTEGLRAITVPAATDATIRERYTRCAKLIIQGGSGSPALPPPVGMPLELVPAAAQVSAGGTLRLTLLRNGAPLPGVLVKANPEAAPHAELQAITDDAGQVRFTISHAGPWLVHAVHMEPASDPELDWESWWASLTLSADPAPLPGAG